MPAAPWPWAWLLWVSGWCWALALGLLASALRGWVEEVIMRMSDFTFAFPAIFIGHHDDRRVRAQHGSTPSSRLAIFNIPTFARITRASAMQCGRASTSWLPALAAKTASASHCSTCCPNILGVLTVQATIQFALAILAEAALSYLGLGTQPPQPSWGRMLSDAQTLMYQAPLLAVFPGVAIALSVLGLNLLGDGLRDVMDPRLSRQR